MRTNCILAGIAVGFLATSAQAADIPRPVYKGVRSVVAYYNWTGFHIATDSEGRPYRVEEYSPTISSTKVKPRSSGISNLL